LQINSLTNQRNKGRELYLFDLSNYAFIK